MDLENNQNQLQINKDHLVLGIAYDPSKQDYIVIHQGNVVRVCQKRNTALIELAGLIDAEIN